MNKKYPCTGWNLSGLINSNEGVSKTCCAQLDKINWVPIQAGVPAATVQMHN